MFFQGYELEIFSPVFFSSFEGNIISTEGIISSTALTYALADALRLRDKDYFLYGTDTTTPKYQELSEVPIFATDAVATNLKYTPIEFRSAMLWAEENIQISSQRDPYPSILTTASKSPFFKQVRQYVGVEIGSKFQCVIVSQEKLDDEIFVNIGIRKNGEGRLKKSKTPEYVSLNYFMLDTIYKIPREKLLIHGTTIKRSGDYRLFFIQGVPLRYFENEILPLVVKKWRPK